MAGYALLSAYLKVLLKSPFNLARQSLFFNYILKLNDIIWLI